MRLDDMQVFVKVVEAGSFTGAGRLLGRNSCPAYDPQGGRRRSTAPRTFQGVGGGRRGADPAYVPQGGAGAKQRNTKQNQRKNKAKPKQNQAKADFFPGCPNFF